MFLSKRLSFFPTSTTRHCKHRVLASYHDRFDVDDSNRVFYIYSLSRYNNRPYYHYGTTLDIASKELMLARIYPCFDKMFVMPIGRMIQAEQTFEKYIEPNKTSCPLTNVKDGFFCLDDQEDFKEILIAAEVFFKSKDRS